MPTLDIDTLRDLLNDLHIHLDKSADHDSDKGSNDAMKLMVRVIAFAETLPEYVPLHKCDCKHCDCPERVECEIPRACRVFSVPHVCDQCSAGVHYVPFMPAEVA